MKKLPLNAFKAECMDAIRDIAAGLEHASQAEEARVAGVKAVFVAGELDDAADAFSTAGARLQDLGEKINRLSNRIAPLPHTALGDL